MRYGVALIFYGLPSQSAGARSARGILQAFRGHSNANLLNHFAALLLLGGGEYLSAFKPDQLQALARCSSGPHNRFRHRLGVLGFHCVVLGYLLFGRLSCRILACCWRLGVGLYGQHFRECYSTCDASSSLPYIMLPAGIAEISLTLWLIIVGVNASKWKAQASAAGASVRT
jgi:hypothetical protein